MIISHRNIFQVSHWVLIKLDTKVSEVEKERESLYQDFHLNGRVRQ